MKIFGFEILPAEKEKPTPQDVREITQKTFAEPIEDDGAINVNYSGHYGTYVDLDGSIRGEVELITKYREMAGQPEIEDAIQDIINEAIVFDDKGKSVELNTDELKQPEKIKKKLKDEFENVLKILNFRNLGQDIFMRWYVDGRLYYHIVVDESNLGEGIQTVRYIDPRRIRKIREIEREKDPNSGMEIIKRTIEYYVYNERGVVNNNNMMGQRISVDSIANINSGLMDPRRQQVLSYLHKAIKPLNMLRMVEDDTVIYRHSRAPERRIFYIDVGNMPTIKANQYVKDIMTRHRNKLVYDATTGQIRDDRKFMAMLEDIWIPRREGGKSTEIDTLQGGQNLGEIDDVVYFEKKLYRALDVPYSRTQPETGFTIGRSQEITRDELKFSKFIDRLRNKFSKLFDELMRVQVTLKNICTLEEWEEIKQDIFYDFLKDNNFQELLESELLRERLNNLGLIEPYVGRYYSKAFVNRTVLRLNDEEIEEMKKEIEQEKTEAAKDIHTDASGNPMETDGYGNPMGDPEMVGLHPELQQMKQMNDRDVTPEDLPSNQPQEEEEEEPGAPPSEEMKQSIKANRMTLSDESGVQQLPKNIIHLGHGRYGDKTSREPLFIKDDKGKLVPIPK